MQREYEPPSGLHPLLEGLLATAHERHVDMSDLVSGLPDGALDWRPAERVNSLAGLVRHIVDIESHAARLGRGDDEWRWDDSDGAHLEEGGTESDLLAAIADCDALVKDVLESLDEPERASPAIEEFDHAAMHYGHMQVTRLLWEQAHPDAPRTYSHWGWPE